jgi:hypothetical protein
MYSSIEILGYKSQGLDNNLIAQTLGCDVELVPGLIEDALKAQYGETQIPSAVLVELTRVDRLIAKLFDDLDSAEDAFCEITGKLLRDGYKTRSTIADTIRKLVETKVKLFNLSLVFKVVTGDAEDEVVNVNDLTLEQKLDKYRSLLEQ